MSEATSPRGGEILGFALMRSDDLLHHVTQGTAWVENSKGGVSTVALSYAAFEFRLAIERIAIHLCAALSTGNGYELDFRDMRSFKNIEGRIYELAGHQKTINLHFEFMAKLLELLKISQTPVTPNIGKLSRFWHDCSELCHIGWSFACGDAGVVSKAAEKLLEIQNFLGAQTSGWLTWPVVQDESFRTLRDEYVAGRANENDVRAYLKKTGVWARLEFNDDCPHQFVGEPIPPTKTAES